MKRDSVPVILTAAWSNARSVEHLARQTDATVLELPSIVDTDSKANTWIGMMDECHNQLRKRTGSQISRSECLSRTTAGSRLWLRRVPIISDVDLTVEPGEILGIAGPNGAGKTTLFRGVLGLLPPIAGEREVSAKAFGYVPQRETLDPLYPLTVAEVVHMGAYGRPDWVPPP